MSYSDKKRRAKDLYISGLYNRKEICEIESVKVSPATLRRWIIEGNWDEEKSAKTITRPQLLQEAYSQLAAINKEIQDKHNGIPNKQLSDAKGVIRKEIEALSEMPLHQYTEVFTEYTQWMNDVHPALLHDHTEAMNQFIEELVVKRNV